MDGSVVNGRICRRVNTADPSLRYLGSVMRLFKMFAGCFQIVFQFVRNVFAEYVYKYV